MVHMLPISNPNNLSPFIKCKEVEEYCQMTFGIEPPNKILDFLFEIKILPIYKDDTNCYILKNDIIDCLGLLDNKEVTLDEGNISFYLKKYFKITSNRQNNNMEYVYNAAIRNLLAFCKIENPANPIKIEKQHYFSGDEIEIESENVLNYVAAQLKRDKNVRNSNACFFANSAYYMGSKKSLGSFLVETISRYLPPDGVVIDLMCGSGAASNAFGANWSTYASDAQEFCQYLARIQGKGFNEKRAKDVIEKIYPLAMKNANELETYYQQYILQEDRFFHSNIDSDVFQEYNKFVNETLIYPTNESLFGWKLYKEVEKRKERPTLIPYCLFTTYFSNIYFGLRQCVEIDSIRYAIDQLENENDKQWALGALIATLSYLGSGYAGHFAQPLKLTLHKTPKTLENRAKSVLHEFSIRLTALARESESAKSTIKIIPGPWENCLKEIGKSLDEKKDVVVYLDAPYKREEYSRYYHLLETLVKYNYPSVTKKGRLPDKKKGERFKSAFFTRSKNKIDATFVEIIGNILDKGWTCAWSYSDNGDANMVNVINEIYNKTNCNICSVATSYNHKSQGKSNQNEKNKQKSVTEYCILFRPN